MSDFGEQIKLLRLNKGLTQKEVGNLIGVSEASVNYYESGKQTPSLKVFIELCNLFDVSADFLLNLYTGGKWEQRSHFKLPVRQTDLTEKQIQILIDCAIEFSKANEKLPISREKK